MQVSGHLLIKDYSTFKLAHKSAACVNLYDVKCHYDRSVISMPNNAQKTTSHQMMRPCTRVEPNQHSRPYLTDSIMFSEEVLIRFN